MDTWSPCWRLREGSDAARRADELAARPTVRGGHLFAEPVEGHRVAWWPSFGLLAAEGHPAPGRLARAGELPGSLDRLSRAMRESLGLDVPETLRGAEEHPHGFDGVRRLDLTVDLACENRSTGLGVLRAIAGLEPHGKLAPIIHRQAGGAAVETISWAGRRGKLARVYDKGIEAGTAPRGHLLRFEDQRRWGADARRDVEELTGSYVREKFTQRFAPLWQASKGVKLVTETTLVTRLQEAVDADDITPGQAIDIAGHLLLERHGARVASRATYHRHRRLAREIGLVLVDGTLVEEEMEIDLGDLLEECFSEDTWESTQG